MNNRQTAIAGIVIIVAIFLFVSYPLAEAGYHRPSVWFWRDLLGMVP